MANLQKQVRQHNENLLIEDMIKSRSVKKGGSYRSSLSWLKRRCPMTDNGKEGVRDYEPLVVKLKKRLKIDLQIYSKEIGTKDLPIDKIDEAAGRRLLSEEIKRQNTSIEIKPLTTSTAPIEIKNTVTRDANISTNGLIVTVISSLVIGTLIGAGIDYFARKKKEKENKKNEEK